MNTFFLNSCFFLLACTVYCLIDRVNGKFLADDRRDSQEGYKTNAEVYQSIKEAVRRAGNGIDAGDLDKVAKSVYAYADSRITGVSREDIIKEISEAAERWQVKNQELLNLLTNQNQAFDQLESVGQNMDAALKIWNALADKGENANEDDKVLAAVAETAKTISTILKSMVTEIVFYAKENKQSTTSDGPVSVVVNSVRDVREISSNSRIKRDWSVCVNVLIVSGCYSWG